LACPSWQLGKLKDSILGRVLSKILRVPMRVLVEGDRPVENRGATAEVRSPNSTRVGDRFLWGQELLGTKWILEEDRLANPIANGDGSWRALHVSCNGTGDRLHPSLLVIRDLSNRISQPWSIPPPGIRV